MALLSRRRALVCATVLWAACGDALVDGDYRGTPLYDFSGQVVSFQDLRPQGHAFRVGVFWSPSGRTDASPDTLIEQASASVQVGFPALFDVAIFQPPEARMLGAGGVGVGVVLIYEDRDDDGRYTAGAQPSELVGGAADEALLYASAPVDAALSPTSTPLDAGFQLIRLPFICEELGDVEPIGTEPPAGAPDCDVPLGAPCDVDAHCGPDGTCLRDLDGIVFAGGYCAVRADETRCAPADGRGQNLFDSEQPPTHWFLACVDDADCRADQGYECDDYLASCVPDVPIDLEITSSFVMQPLCAEIEFIER